METRANLYHLVSQVLAYEVEGELVESGAFAGESAVLIATVVVGESAGRRLHVYDTFEPSWNEQDPRGLLEQRFRERALPVPTIHVGYFETTVPQTSPKQSPS